MAGILIIDDRPDTRLKTIEELKKYGYRIHAQADASRGEEAIGSDLPGLVLINRHMVSVDSVSLFLQIKEKYPQLPVMLYALKSDTALKSLNQAITMAFRESRAGRRQRS